MPDDEVAAAMAKVREYGAVLDSSNGGLWGPEYERRIEADIRRPVEERDEALKRAKAAEALNEDATKGMAILNGEIGRLREGLQAAEADAARLAEALKFYAIRERYFHENEACPEICEDEGTKARAALAAHDARLAAAGKAGT